MSPSARTKRYLESDGWAVDISERRVPFMRNCTKDLFGFADMVALKPGIILGVQATTADHISHRVNKILGLDSALKWLTAGGRIMVIGWAKKDGRWQARERWISQDAFMGV